jgi:ATP-binding cassette subfamily F protein uup
LRERLDPDKDLIDNVCGGQDFIEINGRRRHAISYLGEFLFTPDRVRMPVKALSGGEQNRAILARLFSKPANLLVLDEPTNDLDVETLELLEEILMDFDGTVLLVSHDREFMDNVVTSILVLDGSGRIEEYVGGYSSWIEHGGRLESLEQSQSARRKERKAEKTKAAASKPRKLSYKFQLELDALPAKIEKLENRQSELSAKVADPAFYQQAQELTAPVLDELSRVAAELEVAYQRWSELEA